VYEWVHEDAWFDVSINYRLPLTIEVHEAGLAVEFYFAKDAWLGKTAGMSITRSWLWEF
jgi:hypothetical protein